MRFVWTATKLVLGVAAFGLLAAVAAIAVARSSLPQSDCVVLPEAVSGLELEKLDRAGVIAALGCDGVLSKRDDYGGKLLIEDYAWRMSVWPYGRFIGHFINGVLHGKQVDLFKLGGL